MQCDHCNEPCEVYYYNTNYGDLRSSKIYGVNSIVLHKTIKTKEQIETHTLYDTFIISISFFGLFFGCSLLTLIQIPYNISIFKTRKSPSIIINKKQERNSKIIDFFHKLSQFKSINCSKYFSAVNSNYEKIKTYFWFVTLLLSFIFSLFLSVQEIIVYSNSKEIFLLSESKDNFHLPKIDFCNQYSYEEILKNPKKQFRKFSRDLSYNINKTLDSLDKIVSKDSSSVIERIKLIFTNKETKELFINDDFKTIKFTDLYDKEAFVNIKLMNEFSSDDPLNIFNDHKSYSQSVHIYPTLVYCMTTTTTTTTTTTAPIHILLKYHIVKQLIGRCLIDLKVL